jgi:hypothetical protein
VKEGPAQFDLIVRPPHQDNFRTIIDLTIATILPSDVTNITWPTDDDILAEVARVRLLRDLPPTRHTDSHHTNTLWSSEDRTDEVVGIEVDRSRAHRKLSARACIDPTILRAEQRKKREHLALNLTEPTGVTTHFTPFVLTAGGGVGKDADKFLQSCMPSSGPIRAKLYFRNTIRTQFSIALIRAGFFMEKHARAPRDLDSLDEH